MADTDLLKLTISELAPKIKAKEISPVDLTEAALAQADRLQPKLNSFITMLLDQAWFQAEEQEAEPVILVVMEELEGLESALYILFKNETDSFPSTILWS